MTRQSFVVDTSASPHALLRPLPLQGVTIRDRFWAPRIATNTQVTLPSQYAHCEETERIANFRRAAGTEAGDFVGLFFNDSDVYKWLEAVGWNDAISDSPGLSIIRDKVVADIVAAQRTDGYLNSYFTKERSDDRWTNFDLHEMYCAGHFFQAAIAIYRTSGARTALDAACKMADHIDATFGPASDGKRPITDGHCASHRAPPLARYPRRLRCRAAPARLPRSRCRPSDSGRPRSDRRKARASRTPRRRRLAPDA